MNTTVIITCFESSAPFGLLTRRFPPAMLPVMAKPLLEHVVERCVESGFTRIHVALTEHPLFVRAFVGEGKRWGAEVLTSDFREPCPYEDTLKRLWSDFEGHYVLIPAETLIDLDLTSLLQFHVGARVRVTRALARSLQASEADSAAAGQNAQELVETGIFCVTPSLPHGDAADFIHDGPFIGIHDPNTLWQANRATLFGRFPKTAGPETGDGPGKWIGHHCRIDPRAVIESPVCIGNHARIGAGAEIVGGSVIGEGVIVDNEATVQSGVIMDHTYVGAYTNVVEKIVSGRFIMNVRTGLGIEVSDAVLMSEVREKALAPFIRRLADACVAGFLLLMTGPFWFTWGVVRICRGRAFFAHKRVLIGGARRGGHAYLSPSTITLRTFDDTGPFMSRLPGLFQVVTGELELVGIRPLPEDEFMSLAREEWAVLRFEAPEGLFTPVDAIGLPDMTEDERVVIENYYASTRRGSEDVKTLLTALFNLIFRTGR